ncbi:MAG: outer membrane lipoprotein-sorting protein [Desulfobacterales bacterium]|nr:outer membrane lipoprotein-sorting protein [Desulfobacterales bacterium]MBF0396916.1 outer membrane lipoprotein-sorting protein [Desulfobacterales bacterium]
MKRLFNWTVLTLLFVILISWQAYAAEDGKEIMKKQKEMHKVKLELGQETMLLVDSKTNNKEKRTVKRYTKDVGDELNRYLVVFFEPSDVKGTALLTWEQKNNKNDQWLYMPALGKMQRIADAGKTNYFMGTDFTYEDMEPEKLESYNYTVIRTEKINHDKQDYDCYVIEAKPATPEKIKQSGYSKRILWITKDNLLTLKAEFYNKREQLQKTYSAYDYTKITGTIWRPKKTLMDNTSKNHKTLTMTNERKINEPIDDSVFTERFILSGNHVK